MKTIRTIIALAAVCILSVGCSVNEITAKSLDKQAAALVAQADAAEKALSTAKADASKEKEAKAVIANLRAEAAKSTALAAELRARKENKAEAKAKTPQPVKTTAATTGTNGTSWTSGFALFFGTTPQSN